MGDLEELLRATLVGRAEGVQPEPGDLLRLRHDVARARRRRAGLRAGAVAAALVLGLATVRLQASPAAGPAAPGPTASSRTRVELAWSGRRVEANTRPETGWTVATTTLTSRVCRARDLQLALVTGEVGGAYYVAVHARNVSQASCELAAVPGLRFSPAGAASTPGAGPGLVLVPGSWAATTSVDARAQVCLGARRVDVTLPGEGPAASLPLPPDAAAFGAAACGGGATSRPPAPRPGAFAAVIKSDAQAALAGFGALHATLRAPGSVVAGTTLEYAVELTNGGSAPIPLATAVCPSVEQELAAAGSGVAPTGWLVSCTQAPPLQPGAVAVLRMRLAVPPSAAVGPAVLSWRWAEPDEPPLTQALTVTAAPGREARRGSGP